MTALRKGLQHFLIENRSNVRSASLFVPTVVMVVITLLWRTPSNSGCKTQAFLITQCHAAKIGVEMHRFWITFSVMVDYIFLETHLIIWMIHATGLFIYFSLKYSLICPLFTEVSWPEGFDEPLHLLGLTLNTDVVLKFPESLIQLHALEVHFIDHTANTWEETEQKWM